MFGLGALERTLNVLTAENTDLRQALRSERDAWAKERKELVDRIIALTAPAAAVIVNPLPRLPKVETEDAPRRFNYPSQNTAPPLPPYPQRPSEKAS